ncbi:MAG: ATP-grasp domain-containing protein [Planctomycetota bacterium]|nr:ATP-grasp domain-containing protein [Planctomycetota bacterium]
MTCMAVHPATTSERQPSTRACNLVLVGNRGVNQLGDFQRVQQYIATDAPDVRAHVVVDQHYRAWRWLAAARPTMVFSPVPLNRFSPLRGRVVTGQNLGKSQEYAALEAAGVPVPRYRLLTEADPRPDVTPLGQYVVVKPDRGGRGAHVRTMRATKARWEPTESRISGKSDALLAQEFIYTGPWPVSYRVTTLFGQVLWALKVEASRTRAPMSAPEAFGTQGGLTVVSNSKGCVMSPLFDEEVIAFGEAAHRAFPDIPLLGIDVVRRATDGKLFVIEVNASGWVWHFSSPLGVRAQKEFGFRFEDQFDGIRKAARVLAAEARRQAC